MANGETPSTASERRATAERIITGFYSRLDKPAPRFLWFEDAESSALVFLLLATLSPDEDAWRKRWHPMEPLPVDRRARWQWPPGFKPLPFKRPKGGEIGAGLWSALEDQFARALVESAPSPEVLNRFLLSFRGQLGNELESELRDRVRPALLSGPGRRFTAPGRGFWGGVVEGGRKGSAETGKAGKRLVELQHACGWWAPCERAVICSDGPRRICVDIDGRLHGQRGPAVEFSEHRQVYAWHGTHVPRTWIEQPDTLDRSALLTLPDAEQRMAGADIVGWARIIEGLPTREIHADDDPGVGTLFECDLPGSPNSRFLRVRCGTGREFVLSVPQHVQTARQANAWTYGLTSDPYELEARS
jgi:hypothetical protein